MFFLLLIDFFFFSAVGIASDGSPMIDADFVRIFYNKTSNQFDTEDAFLSKELNCDFITGGLCSDEKVNTVAEKTVNTPSI